MPRPNRHTLLPFLRWLPRQTRASVGRDAIVGLSGAVLALPQSIAYALIAGLPPEYGLYAAIIPVLIACLWGSSWHLICGPTAAISIVLYASVSPLAVPGSQDYITLILLLTFLAGVFQWLLGLLRFGARLYERQMNEIRPAGQQPDEQAKQARELFLFIPATHALPPLPRARPPQAPLRGQRKEFLW